VAVSSSARHRKIPHSNLTTLDHPVQSVDNSRKTLLSPLNPHRHQLQRPQVAVGAADFLACPLSDVVLVSSSLTDLTACQKSSARVLAISKPDVPSDDELRTFISGYKNTSLSSLKPLSIQGMHSEGSSSCEDTCHATTRILDETLLGHQRRTPFAFCMQYRVQG
jgi:hypothetical protein